MKINDMLPKWLWKLEWYVCLMKIGARIWWKHPELPSLTVLKKMYQFAVDEEVKEIVERAVSEEKRKGRRRMKKKRKGVRAGLRVKTKEEIAELNRKAEESYQMYLNNGGRKWLRKGVSEEV